MKVLLLGAGKRVKAVQYLREAGADTVVAADCSELAPALYAADRFHIVPRSDSAEFVPSIREICMSEGIGLCIPTLDVDLEPMAQVREEFASFGTTVMISPLLWVRLANDKWKMFQFCTSHGIPTPYSWIDRGTLEDALAKGSAHFPLFSKPVTGAGSAYIGMVRSAQDLDTVFAAPRRMIIQELMDGPAVDVDVYLDLHSGAVRGMNAKKKLRMRDGTTDRALILSDPAVAEFIGHLFSQMGFRGVVNVDLFLTTTGYSFLEINPRFGWSYPHSHECGANFVAPLLAQVAGQSDPMVRTAHAGWRTSSFDAPMLRRTRQAPSPTKTGETHGLT
ncbi:ATP-grasp domain-containing protein [Ancrocorticia populi]|uniref:ATP-grasp domain-containing protein n=1 Tax=Ancrocorticia populi TaxID=2175228 RepID=UPI003F9089EA